MTTGNRHTRARPWAAVAVVALLLGGPAAHAAGAKAVGKATLVRGAVSAQVEGVSPRLLASGSEVYAGDVLTTGAGSVAVLDMADGTRMALRPDTVFQVERYDTEPQRENAFLRLFKGGLRAITGFLSKRRSDAFRVSTARATIGIRGTTFDLRVCTDDCAREAASLPPPVGRVGLARGQVRVENAAGLERALRTGARIREGDIVRTGANAFAVLMLADGSRVTVAEDSAFRVDRLRHREAAPSEGSGLLSLLRGGLRVISGLIARNAPQRYRIRTPVATIGIRGTQFDLLCQGLCVSPPGTVADPRSTDGLFAEVQSGTIDFDGQHPLSQGGVLFLWNVSDRPLTVPGMPKPFVAPAPGDVDAPPFTPADGTPPDAGLYLACYEGRCALITDLAELGLTDGEAGWLPVGERRAVKLEDIDEFQSEDQFLRALDPRNRRIFELLGDPNDPTGAFECRV